MFAQVSCKMHFYSNAFNSMQKKFSHTVKCKKEFKQVLVKYKSTIHVVELKSDSCVDLAHYVLVSYHIISYYITKASYC